MIPHRLRPRDDLGALEGYHSPQLQVSVRLNTNESPFAPPPGFVDDWLDAVRDVPLHRYPDRGAVELRRELGARLGQPPERIFCANGSNEVLQTLLLTYGGAGRRVAVFEPTYALHSHIARITGTEVVVGERRADFSVDAEEAGRLVAATDPVVVLLCSPNNPTGTPDLPEVVEAVAAAAPGLVVVDEAYGEFADRSALELVAEDRPLVVVRTYSKVWSMAAMRLGYCVAPEWVVGELEKVVLPYHLSVPTQLAGTVALRFETEMAARVAWLVEERRRLAGELEATEGVMVFPSGANFLLLRVPDGPGEPPGTRAGRLWERLLARDVLVRDFSRWPRLEGCLRVTVGTRAENDQFVVALRAALPEVVDP
ncbi:MAG: histidinol-phosphate transaminase [Acidimicrobiia bacterium]|nr:histidinol-phosphate transaminase [Acidimicrobiia bacterium]